MEKINKSSILSFIMNIIIFSFLFFNNIAPHTIFSKISLLIFIIYTILVIIINKKLYFNYYFIFYIIFIIFIFVCNYLDIYVDSIIVNENMKTIIINFLFLFCVYNFLKINNNIKIAANMYVVSFGFSLLVIVILFRNSLFTMRLAHAWGKNAVSYYFFGQPVSMSSNLLGFQCDICFLLLIYKYYNTKNKKYILFSLFFILGLSLTGSRKAFIIFAIFIVFSIFNYSKNKQFIINIFKGILIITIMYFAIIKIPFLYKIVGNRLESLINYLNNSIVDETSVSMRKNLSSYAIAMFNQKPSFGYGLGYFYEKYSNVVENNFLELLVGVGLYGTILYYFYTLPSFIMYLKFRKKSILLKMLGIIMVSIIITEIGSSIYFERNYIMFIPVFIYEIMNEREKYKKSNKYY